MNTCVKLLFVLRHLLCVLVLCLSCNELVSGWLTSSMHVAFEKELRRPLNKIFKFLLEIVYSFIVYHLTVAENQAWSNAPKNSKRSRP